MPWFAMRHARAPPDSAVMIESDSACVPKVAYCGGTTEWTISGWMVRSRPMCYRGEIHARPSAVLTGAHRISLAPAAATM